MLDKLRLAAIAATLTLTLAPGASLGGTSSAVPAPAPQARAATAIAAASAAAPARAPAPEPEFGLHAHEHDHGSGLAPGQSADDFRAWLAKSPANRARLEPILEGAEPFEVAPADKWDNIVTTLKFVRDKVEPAIGKVEALSAYRNERLNACSAGAPKSAHRQFFALDLTPVAADVSRDRMIRGICAAHARSGSVYRAGLGFYSGKRFHVDSNGYRKWGPDGRGASSPCVTQA